MRSLDGRLSRIEAQLAPQTILHAVMDEEPRPLDEFPVATLDSLINGLERREVGCTVEMWGRTRIVRFVPTPGAPVPRYPPSPLDLPADQLVFIESRRSGGPPRRTDMHADHQEV